MIFPGIYLFTWAGFLMHECWHKYVPNIPTDRFYGLFALMLLTDPQIYRVVHGYHHGMVHSWDDTEFHPLGYIKNLHLRRLYNFLEIFLGIAFLSAVATYVVPRHPKYKAHYRLRNAIIAVFVIILFLGGIAFASRLLFGVNIVQIMVAFVLTIWLNSVFLHHSQMVEHGNLVVEGNFQQRNAWTRNLNDNGITEKIFLFLTHGDSREHVLHHTLTSVYSRPFPHKVPMPKNAVYITIEEYLGVLGRMLRGDVDIIKTQ